MLARWDIDCLKVGILGEDAERPQPEPTDSGQNAVTDTAPSPPSESPPPAAPPEGAETPPDAISDIQRRAMLAETDLTTPPPDDPEQYLQKITEEIVGLEGEEGLQELERTRDQLNMEAENHKITRDKLNMRTKQLAEKRDTLNGEVAQKVTEAAEHREKRNKLNEEVKTAKVRRDELNAKANELGEIASKLKRERHKDVAVPVPRLREDMRALEFKMQTQVLTPAKE